MKSERRERILIMAAAVCIGLLAGDRFLLSPVRRLWAGRSQRIEELTRFLNKGETLLDRETILQRRWEALRMRALPMEAPLAEDTALRRIHDAVERSGMTVTSLRPQWTEPAEDEGGFPELGFRATGRGDIQSIARFLFELERGDLAVRLKSVEVVSQDPRGAELTLDVDFSALALPREG